MLTQAQLIAEINAKIGANGVGGITGPLLNGVLQDMVSFTGGTLSWQNIKTNWGAVGDGVTDDSQAFFNFNAYARAQTNGVVLVVPPGSYITQGVQNGATFWVGVKKLAVFGYGATFSALNSGGVIGQKPIGVGSARIASTNVGDTTITLLTPAQTSILTLGDWVCISSLDMQGGGSAPPNWYQFEFRQIININAGTGVVTLDAPLRYAHLSTYPCPTLGSLTYDAGGPASVFLISQDWVQNVEFYGGAINATGFNGVNGQFCKFVDYIIHGANFATSVSERTVFENCIFTGTVELDKLITIQQFRNCTFEAAINAISASIDHCIYEGCDFTAGVNGTAPKSNEFTNCHVNLLSINSGFGPPGSLNIQNSRIDKVQVTVSAIANLADMTFSNGTFSIANASGNISELWPLYVPGTQLFINGSAGAIGSPPNLGFPLTVLNARQDGTNTYVDTTLTAVPSYTVTGGGSVTATGIVMHPCVRETAIGATGDQSILDAAQTINTQPIFSHVKRLLTGNITSFTLFEVWGAITELNINVVRAYSGAQPSLSLNMDIGFLLDQTTATWTHTTPSVNLKIAGLRTVTQAAVTGAQSGDSLLAFGTSNWAGHGISVEWSADISADHLNQQPIVIFEVLTDQGLNAIPIALYGTTIVTQN